MYMFSRKKNVRRKGKRGRTDDERKEEKKKRNEKKEREGSVCLNKRRKCTKDFTHVQKIARMNSANE